MSQCTKRIASLSAVGIVDALRPDGILTSEPIKVRVRVLPHKTHGGVTLRVSGKCPSLDYYDNMSYRDEPATAELVSTPDPRRYYKGMHRRS